MRSHTTAEATGPERHRGRGAERAASRLAPPSDNLFHTPERHPLHPASAAASLGHTVVLAPHPDDESLGCGGLLATLDDLGLPARVVVVTDGTRSHPNSREYPRYRLRGVREREAKEAVSHLGGHPLTFLRYRDCGLPEAGTLAFRAAADRLAAAMAEAETVVVPWRRDPHCDHEATWALAREAVRLLSPRPRWLEYSVWAWPEANAHLAPRAGEAVPWRLDVSAAQDRKRRAVRAHRSQTTRLITDDPDGFCLSADMLALFDRSWELFLAPRDA